jgi:hypothetical protein
MWLFLWIIFVIAIIVAFVWSYHILFEQKRAWRAFAEKYNLDFAPGGFWDAPEASGFIKGRRVNLYSQPKQDIQTRTASTQNIIEVFLNTSPDTVAVVASSGFMDFLQSIDLPAPFIVEDTQWPAQILARTFDDERPDLWFLENSKRIEAIQLLSKLPFDIGFVCDRDRAFVVVRTSHPLTEPKRINQIIGKLFQAAELLES